MKYKNNKSIIYLYKKVFVSRKGRYIVYSVWGQWSFHLQATVDLVPQWMSSNPGSLNLRVAYGFLQTFVVNGGG